MALLAIIHAAIAGFMLFFTAVVPQAAFKTLSAKAVGAFLRVLFPRLFLFGLALSLVASGAALAEQMRGFDVAKKRQVRCCLSPLPLAAPSPPPAIQPSTPLTTRKLPLR